MQTPALIIISRKTSNSQTKKLDYAAYWKIIWRAITPNERMRTQKK